MDTQWILNLFGIIGIIIAVIVLLIALVWLVCFVVRLLIKTFGVKVKSSYELMVEDITKKAKAKKARNEQKRKAKNQEKQELLDMKLASDHKIFLMKRQKLQKELEAKENEEKQKHLGEDVFFEEAQEKLYQNSKNKREEEMASVEEDSESDDEIKLNDDESSDEKQVTQSHESEVQETKVDEKIDNKEETESSKNSKSQKSHTFNQGINIIDALAKEEKQTNKSSDNK